MIERPNEGFMVAHDPDMSFQDYHYESSVI